MLYINTGVEYESLDEFLQEFAELFNDNAIADLRERHAESPILSIETGPGPAYAITQLSA